jgi:hypothetical protein
LQLGLEGLDLIVVGDDVEQIVLVQIVQHVFQGCPHLLDLLARHAARSVDDEDDRFRLRLWSAGLLLVGWT